MAGKTLILKSGDAVMGAYVVAPLAGMTVLWASITLVDLCRSGFSSIVRDLLILVWIFPLGTIVCGLAEVVLVTPVLCGFSRYGWKWLNGWTAGLLGFLAGSVPLAILEGANVEAALNSVFTGLVGLTVAVVFRLMAITTEAEPS